MLQRDRSIKLANQRWQGNQINFQSLTNVIFLCFPTLKYKSNQNENQKSPPAGHSDHTAEYDRNVKNSIRIELQEK